MKTRAHASRERWQSEQTAPDRPPDGAPAAFIFDTTIVDLCINLVQT